EHIPEDIKRRRQTLNEVIDQIVVGIGAVVKERAKRGLPLLRLQNSMSVQLARVEPFKVQLADRTGLRTRRDLEIIEVRDQVRPVDEPGFRIEVGLNRRVTPLRLNQVAVVRGDKSLGPVLALLF